MSTISSLPSLARASSAFLPLQSTIDTLWAKLAPSGLPTEPRKIGFVSAQPGEGTTTVATCAAIGLARHMRANVLLVEANYRRPGLANYLQAPSTPGLVEVLSGNASIDSAIQKSDVPGLSILPSGFGTRVSPGFFSTEHATAVLDEFPKKYDFIILDVAPVLSYPESHSLLWRTDEACLVVRFGKTRQEAAKRAATEITSSGVHLIGSILNRHHSDLPGWLAGPQPA